MTQSTLPVDRAAAAAFLEFDSWEEAERLNRRAPELAEMHAFARHRIEHSTPDRNAVLARAIKLLETTPISDFVNKKAGRLNWEQARDEVSSVLGDLRALTTTPEPTSIPIPEVPADHAAELQRIFDQTQKFDPKAVIGGRTPEPTDRNAVLESALRECADKLWVLRCNSRDAGDRQAAERACDMATAALTTTPEPTP